MFRTSTPVDGAAVRRYNSLRSPGRAGELSMPIYEFRCQACRRRVSVFQRSISAPVNAACPHCGSSDLRRLVSRFAVVRGEDALLDGMDDDSLLSGVDENDPRSVAAWARKMGSHFGEDLGPDFDEAVERMEAGEMPDEEAGDESGGDFDNL
jgi:putative FmdB family regulatory protein